MFIFNFIVEHWILSLVVYVLVSSGYVQSFHEHIMSDCEIRSWYNRQWSVIRFTFSTALILLAFVFVPVLSLIAKPFVIKAGRLEKERQRVLAAEHKQSWDENNQRLLAREKEKAEQNPVRAEARKAYLAANPLKLYYNTVDGITAVMKPADYDKCRIQTKRFLRDQRWTKEGVLIPSQSTYLFLQQSGVELFRKNFNTGYEFEYTCGWLSTLDDIVEKNGIRLEQKSDIFVPFVNEAVLPFNKHVPRLNYRWTEYELTRDLVHRQAPEETWPLE